MKKVVVGLGIFVAVIVVAQNQKDPALMTKQSEQLVQPPSAEAPGVAQPALAAESIGMPAYAPLYYGDDPCTIDCSGHEAGADWAEENGIDDPDDCGGNSDSFIEGCQTYVEDKLEEAAEIEDGDED